MDAEAFGRLDDGTPVHRFRLAAEGIAVEALDYGATLAQVHVRDRDGQRRNVALGHPDLDHYVASTAFFGCVVGRVANRIAGARFELEGRAHRLTANEAGNTLHGGDGFDKRVWTVRDSAPDRLVLEVVSPDGDQGFPGELTATVTYRVAPDELRIDYTATTTESTVVNLTNHAYWNLDGEAAPSIDDHRLQIRAEAFTPTGGGQLPTGDIARVAGTPLDWREPRRIGDQIRIPCDEYVRAHGLDHNFVVSGSGLREHARLASPASGIALTVVSTEPGIQAYTGNFLDGRAVGTSGRLYRQGAGIALETQHFPDSPNQPAFPSTVLRPGETFTSTTVFRFSRDG